MYKIDKKNGNLNRKTYIDSNFEHLLASNFTESLFLTFSNAYKILHDLLDAYFRQIFSKILEKKCCFLVRIRRSGMSRSRMQEWRGKKNGNVPRLRSLLASHRQAGWECKTLLWFQIWDHWIWVNFIELNYSFQFQVYSFQWMKQS